MRKHIGISALTLSVALAAAPANAQLLNLGGDGSLLDHSLIQYGSGMSDSNLHSHQGLPLVVLGGGAGTVKGNRHLNYPAMTPLANLHVSYAQKFGLSMESFGDSTGTVAL